jgi:hypothetical protein
MTSIFYWKWGYSDLTTFKVGTWQGVPTLDPIFCVLPYPEKLLVPYRIYSLWKTCLQYHVILNTSLHFITSANYIWNIDYCAILLYKTNISDAVKKLIAL